MQDDREKRIETVLGNDNGRCARNALRWRAHLLENLPLPLRVTGTEDFPWEERYVIGGWDPEEYKELKKSNPSFEDIFDLVEIGEPGKRNDLIAKIKRLSDGKEFEIGLSWLMPEGDDESLHTSLRDYGGWHWNY